MPNVLRRLLWVWGFFGLLFVGLILLGVFLPGIPSAPAPSGGETTIVLRDPLGVETTLSVDLADTPQEQTLGLMNRPVVERGMLFAFDDDAPRSFWMKNTLVTLDIAFFGSDGAWVSSARMEPCVADPCPTYPSAGPARYALELAAGDFGASIGPGWTLEIAGR